MHESIPNLEFKRNFRDCVLRHRALQRAARGCLIVTDVAADAPRALPAIPALEHLDFESDPLRVARLTCERAERLFAVRSEYDDDSIPFAAPRFGAGIIGGMLLGALEFGADTSWTHPVGTSLDEATDFPWGTENVWLERVVASLETMARRLEGRCYVFLEGYHAPLEWATAVRGSHLYLDMLLEPDGVHRLLRRCDAALTWLYEQLAARVTLREYGTLAHSLWMERGLPFLSDDSAGCLSVEHYAEFGMPYTGAMFERFGGGFLHFHTLAYHQMPNLTRMPGLTMYNWRPDPNTPAPGDILPQLLPGAQAKIVMLALEPEQIRARIDLLAAGRFVLCTRCQDRREQEAIIRLVHERAPLVPLARG